MVAGSVLNDHRDRAILLGTTTYLVQVKVFQSFSTFSISGKIKQPILIFF